MNVKGQGALEYLLLIGGAVLVAAIVIALITGIPTTTPNPQISAGCAAQFTCPTCVAWDFAGNGVGADCRVRQDDGTTATACPLGTGRTFVSCIPR